MFVFILPKALQNLPNTMNLSEWTKLSIIDKISDYFALDGTKNEKYVFPFCTATFDAILVFSARPHLFQ